MNNSPHDKIKKLPVFLVWYNQNQIFEERERERAIPDQLTFILLEIIFFLVVYFIQEPIKNLLVKEYRG